MFSISSRKENLSAYVDEIIGEFLFIVNPVSAIPTPCDV
jgi:hypothetical protein